MNRKFFALALVSGFTLAASAGVKVTNVDLATIGNNGFVTVGLDGRSNELPDIKVYGKTIEITLQQAASFNAISKNVRGAQLSANVLNGKAIVKAILPYEVNADLVNLGWKNNNIEVVFPRGKTSSDVKVSAAGNDVPLREVKESQTTPVKEIKEEVKKVSAPNKVSKDSLNEDYLDKLMNENTAVKPNEAKTPAPLKEEKKDEVNVQQAALLKPMVETLPRTLTKTTDNFSFAGYAAKFTVFLALVLGLFYGVVQLLKKGLFSKGKLGFLNNSQMIEVLSTTYVSPKRSLMIVKAHKQIFLVANSESGLEFLSEMKDTSGLIKEGEKAVTGTNFDVNLSTLTNMAEVNEAYSSVKLKENIMESAPEPRGLAKVAVARDIVKFSDELKKKAKKLKPIEFN